MTSCRGPVPDREWCQGVRQIVRFNWPYYLAAVPAAVIGPALVSRLPVTPWVRVLFYCAAALPGWWLAASLTVSWLVYDRSPLMETGWIVQMLGSPPARWISIHAGFDTMTPLLRAHFSGASGTSHDVFDPVRMTEASIARARRHAGSGSGSVDFRHLPESAGSAHAVFVLLAAHELRSQAERTGLFREIRRTLAPSGRVIVVEHLRDLPNFPAYGPGFLHFHRRRNWMKAFDRAGFSLQEERSITPFVRAFLLREKQ